jgi:hypothetical protein
VTIDGWFVDNLVYQRTLAIPVGSKAILFWLFDDVDSIGSECASLTWRHLCISAGPIVSVYLIFTPYFLLLLLFFPLNQHTSS